MKLFTSFLEQTTEFQELCKHMSQGETPVAFSGLSGVHRAHVIANLKLKTEKSVLVLVADQEDGERLCKELTHFLGIDVPLFTSRPFLFHGMDGSHEWEQQRIRYLNQWKKGEVSLLVSTIEGALQRTLPADILENSSFHLKVGDTLSLPELASKLVRGGYVRSGQVEGMGQFSIRGGIIDVFSPNSLEPIRLDFFGDELDSMGYFDVATQRRRDNLEEVTILPVMEVLPFSMKNGKDGLLSALQEKKKGKLSEAQKIILERDITRLQQGEELQGTDRYMSMIYPDFATVLDYTSEETVVIFSESNKVGDRGKSWQLQMEEDYKVLLEEGNILGDCCSCTLSFSSFIHQLENFPQVYLDSFTLSTYPSPPKGLLSMTAKQLPPFGTNIQESMNEMGGYQKQMAKVLVFVTSTQRATTLYQHLEELGISSRLDYDLSVLPEEGEIIISLGNFSGGMEYPEQKLVVFAEGSGTSGVKPKTVKKSATNRQHLQSLGDLVIGDLVVHEMHGIGRFLGMEKMKVDGLFRDYIKIAYAGTDQLFVPATQLDMVSKYIGGGEDGIATKKLSKLGGSSWEKSKKQAKKAVLDLAKGLIELYAERKRLKGFAFSPDSPWQKEFEAQFPFVETEHQLISIEEIKRDMEREMPMDRLLCGDVGFGKTEVAFRAMMKCVQDGKQTAILVPTTVLARQHFLSCLKRFEKYPVTIDVVSRFRTPAQMKETVRKVQNGEIDILIGTHRLFQKDVVFKDLGLLVVDEEQRFGVSHKEKLKERFAQVDVLTLSATPIPRTLNMALSGIRDMSTLEEPPPNRQPVQTYVMEENWSVLRDAMLRELERGGQVYFLHNRVDGIEATAGYLKEMLGEIASVAVAHGKMDQTQINQVMSDMTDGVVNVLICTTIIETGIDLPNANTLIIQDADRLGLSQLHQIRGRVGRSSRRAFAYLTYKEGKILSEVASKRLSALREFAQFGSGFQIAMRDLEIRGAGNVLGPEQSGFLLSVGYDLYLKLLEDAVLTEQGLPVQRKTNCLVDLTLSASIPDRYVEAMEQRMDLYRRIAALKNLEESEDFMDELIDRYGEPPQTVLNLIQVALLREEGIAVGLTNLMQRGLVLNFYFENQDLKGMAMLQTTKEYKSTLRVIGTEDGRVTLDIKKSDDVIKVARKLISDYFNYQEALKEVPKPTEK